MAGSLSKLLAAVLTAAAIGSAAIASYAGLRHGSASAIPVSAPARVLGIRVSFNRCTGGCRSADSVAVRFTNDSDKPYVRLLVTPFQMANKLPAPRLMSISPKASRHSAGFWLFRLAPHHSQLVKFTFVHNGADYYCAAGRNFFTKCSP